MKVLIISSNNLSKTRNNGKTLGRMFSAFDPKEVCQIFVKQNGPIDFDAADSFYHIDDKTAIKKILFPWKRISCVTNAITQNNTTSPTESENNPSNSIVVRRTLFTQIIREFIWLISNWFDSSLKDWLEGQKPDVIFFQAGYPIFMHRMTRKISKYLNVPIAIHFTDDYVIYPKRNLYRKILIHEYKKTLNKSSLFYAIGTQMASEYSDFFNRPFKPIMNIVSLKPRTTLTNKDIVQISYFGSLYYNRLEAIKQFCTFLKKIISPKLEKIYQVCIYTSSPISNEQINDLLNYNVKYLGFVSGEDYNHALESTDILLHVESDDLRYKQLTRLSVSTKIPEYLMSYRPIIAFGPTELASIRLINEIDERLVVPSVNNNNNIIKNLSNIINNVQLRKELSEECYLYACKHFLREKVAESFKNDIYRIAHE